MSGLAPLLAVVNEGEPIKLQSIEYSWLLPVLSLVVGALLLLVITSLTRARPPANAYAAYTVVVASVAGITAAVKWPEVGDRGPQAIIGSTVIVDGFSIFLTITIVSALALGALLAEPYLRREQLEGPEFFVLAMLSAAGGVVMASANDLIVLFLGLEILSLALYVMAGYHARFQGSREAAMKYFVLGAFSSALFLYGIALIYGATGSTQLGSIATFLATNVVTDNGLLLAGMVLLLVGLGFKVAAVPFHSWTPDVYQGSPTPATGFMAGAAKAAGFAGLLRVFFSTFGTQRLDWEPVVWTIAVLTLLVGSVLAVVQSDIKRMLAYSSINHAGFVLVGLTAGTRNGMAGSLFYLLAYTFMILGSFAVVQVMGRDGGEAHALSSYRGLASRRPGLAFAFTIFLLAQAGVPLTSGFLAKFYVISAAVEHESYVLAVVAMLAAAIAAFFYLRVIVLMYMSDDAGQEATGSTTASGDGRRPALPVAVGVALAVTIGFTLFTGILPSPVVDFARDAVAEKRF